MCITFVNKISREIRHSYLVNRIAITVFLITLVTVTCNASARSEWNSFKKMWLKEYKNATEELHRMDVYFQNKKYISKHNKKYKKGLTTFYLRMNHFGDLTNPEFLRIMTKLNISLMEKDDAPTPFTRIDTIEPIFFDWREKGAVTPVKFQGHCGSSWAFSATGSLEGQHFLKTGQMVSLSEQNLLDCSTIYGNSGCDGGFYVNAFQYIMENGGIATEKSYPYEGKVGRCKYKKARLGATVKGFSQIPKGDETALMNAVAFVGPMSSGIHAEGVYFQFYGGGVLFNKNCDPGIINHAVLVVGYGTENGVDYWLLKNSASEHWGEEGYMKLVRKKDNHCGIATVPCYPII